MFRLGLSHPVFDPFALAAMPFRRPTTIVSDTSGVVQGGLSFVARNLSPAARLKIPAVVQMEIVNLSDRFLTNWRKGQKARKYHLLTDHMNSQGAQRVLLQLELRSSVEIERTFLLGDPLRAAFQKDEEKELADLNLSVPLRGYADRLILEAARQHQAQVNPGHQVLLLTADQGLARMAITEGLMPLYFRSVKADALFGRTHAGSNLRPFDGQLVGTELAAILWELATIFGTARLTSIDGSPRVSVHAIGHDLAWAPFQSHDDLLWLETHGNAPTPVLDSNDLSSAVVTTSDRQATQQPSALAKREKHTDVSRSALAEDAERADNEAHIVLYKMSIDRLFKLVVELDREKKLTNLGQHRS